MATSGEIHEALINCPTVRSAMLEPVWRLTVNFEDGRREVLVDPLERIEHYVDGLVRRASR